MWSLSESLIWQQINDVDQVKQLVICAAAYVKEGNIKPYQNLLHSVQTCRLDISFYRCGGFSLYFKVNVIKRKQANKGLNLNHK